MLDWVTWNRLWNLWSLTSFHLLIHHLIFSIFICYSSSENSTEDYHSRRQRRRRHQQEDHAWRKIHHHSPKATFLQEETQDIVYIVSEKTIIETVATQEKYDHKKSEPLQWWYCEEGWQYFGEISIHHLWWFISSR